MSRLLSRTFLASIVVLAVVAWTAWNDQRTEATDDPVNSPTVQVEPPVLSLPSAPSATPTTTGSPARAALLSLEVKGRAPKTDYSREQFGQSWRDVDRNGCDQRND